jgi:hypothetical protein
MRALPGGLFYCRACGETWEPGDLQEAAYLEGYEDAQAEANGDPRPATVRGRGGAG